MNVVSLEFYSHSAQTKFTGNILIFYFTYCTFMVSGIVTWSVFLLGVSLWRTISNYA